MPVSYRQFFCAAMCLLCTLVSRPVSALNADAPDSTTLGLLEVYQLAIKHDAAYQSMHYEHQAGQEYQKIGQASLLPVVAANYFKSKNIADVDFNNTSTSRTEHRDYDSQVASLQIRQPIIHYEGMARYRLGKAQTLMSDYVFSVSAHAFILRVFNQYIATLYAQDVLALAMTKQHVFAEQKKSNEYLFAKGEGVKTDAYESQAKFDMAEAEVIEAQDALNDERNKLAMMTGQAFTHLQRMIDSFAPDSLQPSDIDQWKNTALENNPTIIAQRQALEIARQEVNTFRAGHMPKLDAVASLNNTVSDTTNTFNQSATTKSIGLQLSIPIYAGGLVTAQTAQAQFNYQKTEADLQKKTDDVLLELQKQFQLLRNGVNKINALKNSLASAKLLIEATQKSQQGGVRTNLDVLNAEYQLFQVKRDLALAQYLYLQSYLNFKQAAGSLGLDDLQEIARYFTR